MDTFPTPDDWLQLENRSGFFLTRSDKQILAKLTKLPGEVTLHLLYDQEHQSEVCVSKQVADAICKTTLFLQEGEHGLRFTNSSLCFFFRLFLLLTKSSERVLLKSSSSAVYLYLLLFGVHFGLLEEYHALWFGCLTKNCKWPHALCWMQYIAQQDTPDYVQELLRQHVLFMDYGLLVRTNHPWFMQWQRTSAWKLLQTNEDKKLVHAFQNEVIGDTIWGGGGSEMEMPSLTALQWEILLTRIQQLLGPIPVDMWKVWFVRDLSRIALGRKTNLPQHASVFVQACTQTSAWDALRFLEEGTGGSEMVRILQVFHKFAPWKDDQERVEIANQMTEELFRQIVEEVPYSAICTGRYQELFGFLLHFAPRNWMPSVVDVLRKTCAPLWNIIGGRGLNVEMDDEMFLVQHKVLAMCVCRMLCQAPRTEWKQAWSKVLPTVFLEGLLPWEGILSFWSCETEAHWNNLEELLDEKKEGAHHPSTMDWLHYAMRAGQMVETGHSSSLQLLPVTAVYQQQTEEDDEKYTMSMGITKDAVVRRIPVTPYQMAQTKKDRLKLLLQDQRIPDTWFGSGFVQSCQDEELCQYLSVYRSDLVL